METEKQETQAVGKTYSQADVDNLMNIKDDKFKTMVKGYEEKVTDLEKQIKNLTQGIEADKKARDLEARRAIISKEVVADKTDWVLKLTENVDTNALGEELKKAEYNIFKQNEITYSEPTPEEVKTDADLAKEAADWERAYIEKGRKNRFKF